MSASLDSCVKSIFHHLWQNFYALVPFAAQVEQAFKSRGDLWVEDHVAFRSLPASRGGLKFLQEVFSELGYVKSGDYYFETKQLQAISLIPGEHSAQTEHVAPKIFISEIIPTQFSDSFQSILKKLGQEQRANALPKVKELAKAVQQGDQQAAPELVQLVTTLLIAPPPWERPNRKDYEVLAQESEYAAWTYLFGSQINHFTVSAHLMESFSSLEELSLFVEQELKIPMNRSGSLVKGTPEVLLEQSSTMAVKVPYLFQEGIYEQSYAFVEFAKRYPLADKSHDGHWESYFQGFIDANADKIFESTHAH